MFSRSQRVVFRSPAHFVLSVTLVTGTLPALVAENFALPQADQDRLFSQAAKDYNNNLFSNAQAEFEKVQGSRAQEARQYVDKIKAYNNAMYTANDIMRRDVDELVRRTMHQVERNALDESAMVAFSIALNQAQNSISERRSLLTAQGVMPAPPPSAVSEVVSLRVAAAE